MSVTRASSHRVRPGLRIASLNCVTSGQGSSHDEPAAPRRRGLRIPLWAGLSAVGVAVIAVVAVVVGPRLSPGNDACPAIGYSSSLEVTLTGDTADVAHLQVRDHDRWQPPAPKDQDEAAPAIPVERTGDTWRFTLFYPDNPIRLRALDADREVLAKTAKDVAWERVGGSERCGGPMEATTGWVL